MPGQSKPPTKPTAAQVPTKANHHARTALASLLGILAVVLILSSIVVVWLNRTLTDTNTYVSVVGPLASKPEIQRYIAQKASDEIVNTASPVDLAQQVLPDNPALAQQTGEQIQSQIQPVVYNNIYKVVSSPQFATLWTNSNKTVHENLMQQLNSNSDSITLDLSPVINSVLGQLKSTDLSVAADQVTSDPNLGKVDLKSTAIEKAHKDYVAFKRTTVLIVLAAIACAIGAVAVSVHHLKTARRVLMGTGILALLMAASIQVPAFVVAKTVSDGVTQKALVVIVQSFLGNLQKASLIVGLVCVAGAIGSKVYEVLAAKKRPASGGPSAIKPA